ncbi:MAG TPA: hypothetical protein VFC67_27140 [Prolixibacteraceae bacterium]|nr:hypothetical protein [Prolixibacteraceae bacterium]
MSSRRDFFMKTAMIAGATAFPGIKVMADDPVQTTATTTVKLLFKKCVVRSSIKKRPSIEINSNIELKLLLSWEGGSETIQIQPGMNKI